MCAEQPKDSMKEMDWKSLGGTESNESGIGPAVKKRLPKKIRQVPEYYFLPRRSLPYNIAFYGSFIAAGVGAGMLLEVWINKKIKALPRDRERKIFVHQVAVKKKGGMHICLKEFPNNCFAPLSPHRAFDYTSPKIWLLRIAQSKYGFWGWNLWRQPIGFIVFLISSLAECERLPFDLPEAEEELVAGYQTEYSGIKFGLFYIASYLNLLVSSLFVTVLYLGGWNLSIPYIFVPELFGINKRGKVFGTLIGIFITLAKTYLFLFIPIATRWTLPRLRMDQLLNLGWKFLLPISLGNLLLTTSFQLLSL